MNHKALDGIENIKHVGKKKIKKVPAKPVAEVPQDLYEEDHVVRVPRTTPASQLNKVYKVSGNGSLVEKEKLGLSEFTQARREIVLAWMLNGHLHDGQLMTLTELACSLGDYVKTIENDVAALKEKMANYHITDNVNDVPALAHMLMEMKFQDRGRALAIYNIIMGDINSSDKASAQAIQAGKANKYSGALTGRDRAAMYSAALTALDLSNKATNGMDSLFKMTGGVQKLQLIIKAKNLQMNQHSGLVMTLAQIQELIAAEMQGVLPSTRKANPMLVAPKGLELDADDLKTLDIGVTK